ncbi:putative ribonuclease H-like domain-containing protein [Tanacetum coccineum]
MGGGGGGRGGVFLMDLIGGGHGNGRRSPKLVGYHGISQILSDTNFKAATYKRGLATLKGQIVKYREHEVLFSKEIALSKRSVGSKAIQDGIYLTGLNLKGLEEFKEPEVNKYGPKDSSLKPTIGCDKESDNSKENTDDSLEQHQITDTKTSSVKSSLKVSMMRMLMSLTLRPVNTVGSVNTGRPFSTARLLKDFDEVMLLLEEGSLEAESYWQRCVKKNYVLVTIIWARFDGKSDPDREFLCGYSLSRKAFRYTRIFLSLVHILNKIKKIKNIALYANLEDAKHAQEELLPVQTVIGLKELCDEFEKLMKDKFQMSSMGELTFFLGLQVQQKKKGIFISQDKYVHEILRKYNYTDVKSASTPTDLEKPLVQDGDAADVDEHLYRSMIGSLMYLTASRPDIMFAVCACARFQVSPKTSHLLAVKRIFRYLKGKPSLGLWYSKDSPLELVAYTDSDYAGATQDRKSTTGGCQFLGNRLISWQCKKQTVVATSTTEAEYVAAASCCGQVLWIQNQLLDYGYNFMNTVIYIDNNSTICIIENPVQHSKTKHIEIRHHFIRDCNAKKLIQMVKIDTEHNVADLLTKGFDAGRFQYLVSSIGMLNP